MNTIKMAFCLVMMCITVGLNAQSEVTIRFANPTFDCDSKVYCVDVEYSTDMPADTLYGTNVRLFFNSRQLTFREFNDFAPDYSLTNNIEVITGVASSGLTLFNFPAGDSATWINAGVQLLNQNGGLGMTQGQWTKYYSICFDVYGSPDDLNNFCPEIIWDLEEDNSNGGFFSGSDGVVITVKSGDSSERTDENVGHLNWAYSGNGNAPYGDYSPSVGGCISDDCTNCVAPSTAPSLKGGN